jgi:hypothetical protein
MQPSAIAMTTSASHDFIRAIADETLAVAGIDGAAANGVSSSTVRSDSNDMCEAPLGIRLFDSGGAGRCVSPPPIAMMRA